MDAMATKTGKAKLDAVTSLLQELKQDLEDRRLSAKRRTTALEQLKVYGRSVENAGPIFTQDGIETLSRHAFDCGESESSREAMRCLANSLLLQEKTRQLLVEGGYAPKAADRLQSSNMDDEFLVSRILFFATYGTSADFPSLVDRNRLADSIAQRLNQHAERYSSGASRSGSPPIADMALTETSKLIFNIVHFHPGLAGSFSKSIPSLIAILRKATIPSPPLQQPLSSVINALLNLDLGDDKDKESGHSAVFPRSDPEGIINRLATILETAISSYPEGELDHAVSPVVALLNKLYAAAPAPVQERMQKRFLPSDAERSRPLGQSATLPSRLLRLSTSAACPTLGPSISALMFACSAQDPHRFVRNVGYGYAAGFLMSQNLPVPDAAHDPYSATAGGVEINPVTGQRRDAEPRDTAPPMTDEEKEREAERLFVLFERLKNTGVVDVVNPVERARDEGRFEELPND